MPFVTGSNDRTLTKRAEEARQRRSQRSQARVSSVSKRAIHPMRNRPVTIRGNLFGKPIHQQVATKRARRQFYVTMDQHGAELRLPAITVINPGWRLLSGLLAALALAGIIAMFISPFFQIMSVEVSGLQRISPDDLTAWLSLENLSIIEIDPEAITQKIAREYPELLNIQVTLKMPDLIRISATERQPVLAWRKGDEVSWVDTEGMIIPARGEAGELVTVVSETDIPRAPLTVEDIAIQAKTAEAQAAKGIDATSEPGVLDRLTGKDMAKPLEDGKSLEKADPVLVEAAQELSAKLPAETQIVYQPEHGFSWTDAQGWQVYLGKDYQRLEVKWALYQKVTSYLADQGIQPVLVSVELLNAPFYRLEQ